MRKNTSEQYHRLVLEALCAFVRAGTAGMTVSNSPAIDIKAALRVIARREAAPEGPGYQLSGRQPDWR